MPRIVAGAAPARTADYIGRDAACIGEMAAGAFVHPRRSWEKALPSNCPAVERLGEAKKRWQLALAIVGSLAFSVSNAHAMNKHLVNHLREVAPIGSTGVCQDGTYTTSQRQEQECRRRGGLAGQWPAIRNSGHR